MSCGWKRRSSKSEAKFMKTLLMDATGGKGVDVDGLGWGEVVEMCR